MTCHQGTFGLNLDRLIMHVSSTWPKGLKHHFLRQPRDHDCMIYVQPPPSSHMLLHPWIKHFTMIISAWWLLTSNKLSGTGTSKKQLENSEMGNF